jgi:hypothetical protein
MSTSSLDQLELQLEELEASADPHAAEQKFSAPWRRKPGSQLTRRWSKPDSNLYGAFPVKWLFWVLLRVLCSSSLRVLRRQGAAKHKQR